MLIEAAVDTIKSAERAVREGASRLEVCNALEVGGLTPSAALLRGCLKLGVPCMAMVRSRPGDFVYSDADIARMSADASEVLSKGAHGVVFGFLRADHTINEDDTRAMVRIAENAETVFHRAFDDTPDAFAALDALIECGVSRVLTSGHAEKAIDGVDQLAELVKRAAGRITILPGGGVRAENVNQLVDRTGVTEVHARGTDASTIATLCAATAFTGA